MACFFVGWTVEMVMIPDRSPLACTWAARASGAPGNPSLALARAGTSPDVASPLTISGVTGSRVSVDPLAAALCRVRVAVPVYLGWAGRPGVVTHATAVANTTITAMTGSRRRTAL